MQDTEAIQKSTRHPKIIGDLGELTVCNWLSRRKFEVAVVDHTGLDIIAFNPKTKKRLGITVKSRTRLDGTKTESVNLFSKKHYDRKKLTDACEAFGCAPWIAVYVETTKGADLYLASLKHYDKKYRGKKTRKMDTWKMSADACARYETDPAVQHLHVRFDAEKWKP
jgi:hypothetical protein